jgi:hypothetical protein
MLEALYFGLEFEPRGIQKDMICREKSLRQFTSAIKIGGLLVEGGGAK